MNREQLYVGSTANVQLSGTLECINELLEMTIDKIHSDTFKPIYSEEERNLIYEDMKEIKRLLMRLGVRLDARNLAISHITCNPTQYKEISLAALTAVDQELSPMPSETPNG